MERTSQGRTVKSLGMGSGQYRRIRGRQEDHAVKAVIRETDVRH